MNREEIENQLLEIEQDRNFDFSLIKLVNKMTLVYDLSFPRKKLDELVFKGNDTKKATRPNYSEFNIFTKEELELLNFEDKKRFNINDNSYFIIDLKGYVKEVVLNNRKQYFFRVITLDEMLDYIENKIGQFNRKIIDNYKENLYLKSLLYKYAYILLEEDIKDSTDMTLVGMFKNAYFDIIELSSTFLDAKLKR